MRDNILSRLSLGLLFACLCTLFAGCNSGLNQLSEEDRNPYALKAKEMVQDRDFRGAAELYRKALRVNPELANIHLELGLLYDDKLGDPISAIYHYRQYLELKPDSPKRPLVENFIDRAKLNLIAKIPQAPLAEPGDLARIQSEKAALLQENATLQQRVSELEKALAGQPVAAAPQPPAPPPVSTPTEPPVARPTVRTHTVQKSDTLYSLAEKYYGSKSDWAKIYAANRQTMRSPNELKVGQQLVIP